MKYELEPINETKEGDDNTLMKYFFADETKIIDKSNSHTRIDYEIIEKMFKKPLKLRNSLKQCYWDRQNIVYFLKLRIESI